ncbi:MAG: heme ABC exporter ATP-binding protein CcmA [Trueperaceae bacterium]|nr:heme ABC exporter ATP-binding protein CcmA [Trueperaceae bacterium]
MNDAADDASNAPAGAGPPPAGAHPAAPSDAVPAIALAGVDRRWGRERVLRDVHLEVTAGRIVMLRGHNGSGKTTLLRLLATRLRPSAGRGAVFGHDLAREAAAVRRHVAYLSVAPGTYGALTARENLRLATTLLRRPPADADAALERVGLAAHGNRLVRVFSSGMKRRLALARLLLTDAPLWLLDEPYASLDEDGRRLVDQLLEGARRDARTVLVASHEPARLARFVDATIHLEQGALHREAAP